ncbi:hypothetical protein JNUCC0626_28105 [Lentzea sp. JNUCC 0626]|uniref:hypothetical protein n=1 Tax=Lentzea sp. JNUCC 0626 TaxID=3367513 RepID=UPI0037483F8F
MKKLSGGKSLAVFAVAGGAILASVAPVMADVSAQSPSQSLVRVEAPANLRAKGATIEVDVTYVCPVTSTSAYMYVSATQAVGNGNVATGGGSKGVTCTGGFETVKVTVAASTKAFVKGNKAYVKADLQAYPNNAFDERYIGVK